MAPAQSEACRAVTDFAVAFAAEVAAVMPQVRAQYSSLAQASLLMRRNGAPSIEDAIQQEARDRVVRNRRAAECRT